MAGIVEELPGDAVGLRSQPGCQLLVDDVFLCRSVKGLKLSDLGPAARTVMRADLRADTATLLVVGLGTEGDVDVVLFFLPKIAVNGFSTEGSDICVMGLEEEGFHAHEFPLAQSCQRGAVRGLQLLTRVALDGRVCESCGLELDQLLWRGLFGRRGSGAEIVLDLVLCLASFGGRFAG